MIYGVYGESATVASVPETDRSFREMSSICKEEVNNVYYECMKSIGLYELGLTQSLIESGNVYTRDELLTEGFSDKIKSAFSKAKNAVENVWNKIVNFFKDMANKIQTQINNLRRKIDKKILDAKTLSEAANGLDNDFQYNTFEYPDQSDLFGDLEKITNELDGYAIDVINSKPIAATKAGGSSEKVNITNTIITRRISDFKAEIGNKADFEDKLRGRKFAITKKWLTDTGNVQKITTQVSDYKVTDKALKGKLKECQKTLVKDSKSLDKFSKSFNSVSNPVVNEAEAEVGVIIKGYVQCASLVGTMAATWGKVYTEKYNSYRSLLFKLAAQASKNKKNKTNESANFYDEPGSLTSEIASLFESF